MSNHAPFQFPGLLSGLFAGLLLAAGTAPAADLAAGQALHNENCLKCHDDGVYKRKDRKVDSLAALNQQVKRCELSLGLTLFDDQVEDLVHYLNTSYYGFK